MGGSTSEGDAPGFPGADWLRGKTTREVLAKLTDGDPLELRARCEARIRERAQLVSLERLHAKSLVLTARAALSYRGEPALSEWLALHVNRAITNALDEDRDGGVDSRHYEFVARTWNAPNDIARRACVIFNGLPIAVRAAYWALAIDGKSIHRYVAEGHGPPNLVEARAKRAIIAMGTLQDPGGSDGPGEVTHA